MGQQRDSSTGSSTPPTPATEGSTGESLGPAVVPAQGELFAAADVAGRPAEDAGYRGPTACAAAGITYRQLDYWARTGLVEPSIRGAAGSGTQRLYSFRDILVLKVVKRLLDAGVSLQNIRAAVGALRQRGIEDLARITLLSDGTTVYELTSADEVVDLLQGGQAVFAIAVGKVVEDVGGSLANLPSERAEEAPVTADGDTVSDGPGHRLADELTARRHRRRDTG